MSKRRVWIDTDPAITAGNGEVDDAFALFQALRSPELEVVGVSAVFGNTHVDHTYAMAQEILRQAGREDVPVYRGCAGPDEGGQSNAATEALNGALADGPLTIAALGPLTTIAAALSQDHAVLANIADIVFVGGRQEGLEFLATPEQKIPFRDLNFELDAAAAAQLMALGVPMTLAGWEVSATMWLTPDDLDRIAAKGDAGAQWLAQAARSWQSKWQKTFAAPGFTPFDTLAVGWIVAPHLFEAVRWPTCVDMQPKVPLFIAGPHVEGPATSYLTSVDNDALREDLIGRLL
jgi:inosine-uridine nucleoside N-ribohydrolase